MEIELKGQESKSRYACLLDVVGECSRWAHHKVVTFSWSTIEDLGGLQFLPCEPEQAKTKTFPDRFACYWQSAQVLLTVIVQDAGQSGLRARKSIGTWKLLC